MNVFAFILITCNQTKLIHRHTTYTYSKESKRMADEEIVVGGGVGVLRIYIYNYMAER